MACVRSVTYSILINGKPTPPFNVKKGLRQGDPLSPFLFALCVEYLSIFFGELHFIPDISYHRECERIHLNHLMFADDLLLFFRVNHSSVTKVFQAFMKFSVASRLPASPEKSNIYLAGVTNDEARILAKACNMNIGTLPFKYLRIPLSSKKLNYTQCKPLIERITSRAQGWVAKMLSYAGRHQLVRSILYSMQNYWGYIFPLPKKVIKVVKGICRRLWVKSVNAYYIKRLDYSTVTISDNSSWLLRKIIESRELLVDLGGWNTITKDGKFSINQAYKLLKGDAQRVNWNRLICNNQATPESKFVLWLALHNKLATADRINTWNISCRIICSLCDSVDETIQHLFFDYPYATYISSRICHILHSTGQRVNFELECRVFIVKARGSSRLARLYTMCFTKKQFMLFGIKETTRFSMGELLLVIRL
ncbi:uncharacterized protein LOC104888918 [Beta vulgaris subsp. vulgaris]|uniref:uncharacterized protein LOC104888918 n=1 Tax=Beta vulgaris subsp. vulgaris TaxID=3555 RepID=UPI002036942A|nr:uncharacterized protein LOC104888918 [Beta vulgaris subsp. vulgaris]